MQKRNAQKVISLKFELSNVCMGRIIDEVFVENCRTMSKYCWHAPMQIANPPIKKNDNSEK